MLSCLICNAVQLLPTGVHVSIAYPPDTDTPGYASENTSKVSLCRQGCTSVDAVITAMRCSSNIQTLHHQAVLQQT